MKIGIIGAGFTGLASAYELVKKGHEVYIYEKDEKPGGLAVGYKEKEWEWTLEKYYHHLFTNSKDIMGLAREIGHELIVRRPKTSVLVDNQIYQMDSPISLLKFPRLSIFNKLRMALVLSFLRYNPFWLSLERIRAADFLPRAMGKTAYSMLWYPQLKSKFGTYANDVSLAWFWARINERTANLAYPKGGFLSFAEKLAEKITEKGGKIYYKHEIVKLVSGKKASLTVRQGNREQTISFDKVINTLSSLFFIKISSGLTKSYKQSLLRLKGIGAINVVMSLDEQFFNDKTYWLSVCDQAPVLAIVEHTNYMDKAHYANEHIVYLGNYLPSNHPYFAMTDKKLMDVFDPFLKKINKNYKKHIIRYHVFKSPFAQPIIPINYSKIIPSFTTPLKNVFLANIQQVYPWDRGTTHAVEIGKKVVYEMLNTL